MMLKLSAMTCIKEPSKVLIYVLAIFCQSCNVTEKAKPGIKSTNNIRWRILRTFATDLCSSLKLTVLLDISLLGPLATCIHLVVVCREIKAALLNMAVTYKKRKKKG